MRKQVYKIILLGFVFFAAIHVDAQNSTSSLTNQRALLMRDSLDFKNIKVAINTVHNEFSPIPYKGGLLYISNKPLISNASKYNKIYWSQDPGFSIIDTNEVVKKKKDTVIKYIRLLKNDDFTAPTSNDNDILYNYSRLKIKWNEIEKTFANFSTDQAFAYNDSTKMLIYAKEGMSKKDTVKRWELWKAYLMDGRLKHKKRIDFDTATADYLYPFITEDGKNLYFASNRIEGKGGYDIYYVNIKGDTIGSHPIAMPSINSEYDELSPFLYKDSLLFSSNRPGGLGGFDMYYRDVTKTNAIINLGYPVNTDADELGLKKINNQYYLTTNREGNFDVLNVQYAPVYYTLQGVLTYANDGSLVPNHLLYIKDKETGLIIDSIYTDNNAKYSFTAKPNRAYEIVTLNGDGTFVNFTIQTIANQTKLSYANTITGLSPKQKADSVKTLLAILEQKRKDSISKQQMILKYMVHYDFNRSNFIKSEQFILDTLLNNLVKQPNASIVIGAYTDCIGSYKYNYKLSVKRAKSVVNYLVKHGVNKQRILANGYSKKFNVIPCATKANKQNRKGQLLNRRAEIILSLSKSQSDQLK